MTLVHRSLRVQVKAANIRSASFQGRQHLVFPVMACMEGVVHAMGSDAPELVKFDVLERTAGQWNGKPIVGGHPVDAEGPVSALSPDVYEREAFGLMFEAFANPTTRKLEVTAFVDPTRADTAIAKDVVDRLERLAAGDSVDTIEVSIGAFVALRNESGTFDGKPYRRVWTDLTADHLALLESGDRGACSVDMGCGVRAAKENDMAVGVKERLLNLIGAGFRAGLSREEMTDTDLRQSLGKALNAKVPGFLDVVNVTPGQKKVVYAAAPEGEVLFLEQSYTLASDGTVTIADGDPTEVAPRTKFEPLMSAEELAALAAASTETPCGCGGKTKVAAASTQEENMDRKQKIEALRTHKKAAGRYTAKFLESLTDEQLGSLETELNALPEPEAAVVETKPEGITLEQVTETVTGVVTAALAAALPPEFRDAIRSAADGAAGRKDRTIKTLLGLKKDVYTEDELKAMSQDQLDKLLKLIGPQRALRPAGGPFPREEESDASQELAPSPEPMSKQLIAARQAKIGGKTA